jgi:hypothetical protein
MQRKDDRTTMSPIGEYQLLPDLDKTAGFVITSFSAVKAYSSPVVNKQRCAFCGVASKGCYICQASRKNQIIAKTPSRSSLQYINKVS